MEATEIHERAPEVFAHVQSPIHCHMDNDKHSKGQSYVRPEGGKLELVGVELTAERLS